MNPQPPQQQVAPLSSYMSPFQNFVNSVIDPRSQDAQYSSDMSSNAATNLGNMANNAISDVGNIAGGVTKIPGALVSGVNNPQTIAPTLKNLAGSTASGLNDLLGQPVATKNGQITGLQAPSLAESAHNFYKHPVNAGLNAMAVAGGVGAVSNALKGGEAAGAEAGEAGADTSGLTDIGNKVLQGEYKVATNPDDINTLANYGFTKPEDVMNAADQVTGADGVISKMTRDAVSKADPVDMTGVPQTANNLLSNSDFIPDNVATKAYQQILKFTTKEGTPMGGGTQKIPYSEVTNADPLDTYDFIQGLESKAQKYFQDSATPGADPGVRETANFYQNMANEIKDKLFINSGADNQVAGSLTDDAANTLKQIDPSGNLLNDVKNATNVSDLRSVAAPFVRLSQAAQATQKIVAGQPLNPISLGEIPTAPLSFVMRTNVGKNLAGNALRSAGGGVLPSAGGATAAALPATVAGLGNMQNTPQPPPPNPTPFAGSSTPSAGAGTPGVESAPGRYQTLTPQQDGFMTGQDFTAQQNSLAQKIANEKLNNPYQANIDNGQLQQLQNTWNNPQYQSVVSSGADYNKFSGLANMAAPIIQNAPVGLLNLNGSYTNLLNSTDPNYRALGTLLQQLQLKSNVDFSKATSKEMLLSQLDEAMNIMQTDYTSAKQQYFGGNTLNSGAPTQSNYQSQSAISTPTPSGNIGQPVHYNTGFGSVGQGLPAMNFPTQ